MTRNWKTKAFLLKSYRQSEQAMEISLSFLRLLYADFSFNSLEMIHGATRRFLRGLLFLLRCVVGPVLKLNGVTSSRKPCPPIDNDILLLPATELAEKIRKQTISSEEAISAYIARCREVDPLLNAIVEDRFEEALREAREVDFLVRSGVKSEARLASETPLLGIPVTVKESIAVQGMSYNVGVKRKVPLKAKEDADVVSRVRKAGGIPILVSNTPEMCMCWETFNNTTGTTRNPYDTRRTAGGSSGGEAALLGSGASLLSLASDIGGSARLPAMFCGVFGHKPTPKWVSVVGHKPDCNDDEWPAFFTIAPMVRYAVDLPLLLKTMCQSNDYVRRLNQKVDVKSIKYFYMEDDYGSGATHTINNEMKHAIRRLVQHMETTHAVKVQKADLTEMKFAFEVATTILLGLDGVDTIYSNDDDPRKWRSVSLEVAKYFCFASPHTFPNIVYALLKKVADKFPRSFVKRMEEKNAALKKQFQDLLGDNGVLIFPTFPTPAHYSYEIYYKILDVTYMMVYNSLGLPVTQCPVGINKNGLPIGVQIVANPGCDHLSIAVAQEIEKTFGGWREPSTCSVSS